MIDTQIEAVRVEIDVRDTRTEFASTMKFTVPIDHPVVQQLLAVDAEQALKSAQAGDTMPFAF